MPRPVEALPCGSRSTISTRSPTAASAVARLIAVVVLPTPPFWLAIAMMRGRGSGGRSGSTLVAAPADLSETEDGRLGIGRTCEPFDVHVPLPGACRQFDCRGPALREQANAARRQ